MLKQYPSEKNNFAFRCQQIITSTTYKLLSVCSKLNMTLHCSQFDLDGNVKFETKIQLNEYSPLYSLTLRNLPQGGFLLFISRCRSEENISICFKKNSFDVEKFDATGKLVGKLKIDGKSDKACSATAHVFENENNEICLSDVQELDSSSKVILDITCLKDNDFSL